MRPAGVVLAGGASSRFGGDKLAADLDGRPVLQHTVAAVAAVASPVVLVLAPGAPVPPWAGDPAAGLVVARDAESFGGPLVGLGAGLAALAVAAPDIPIAVLAGGDMPALAPAVLEMLVAALADDAAGAATLEADPPAVFPLALRVAPARAAVASILAGGGKRSMRALLGILEPVVVPAAAWRALDPAAATLRDIDTPADLGR